MSFKEKILEVLKETVPLYEVRQGEGFARIAEEPPMDLQEATEALISAFEELVGEHNYITEWSGDSRFDQQVKAEVAGENSLRAELLRKVRE